VTELPTGVTIVAKGRVLSASTSSADGDGFCEGTRMSDEKVKEKFRDNASKVISDARIEEAIEKVFHLEDLKDVRALTVLLH
jgi:outer membrane protein assembly factor BamA